MNEDSHKCGEYLYWSCEPTRVYKALLQVYPSTSSVYHLVYPVQVFAILAATAQAVDVGGFTIFADKRPWIPVQNGSRKRFPWTQQFLSLSLICLPYFIEQMAAIS